MGEQPVLPAAGTNRRVRVFGSVEVFGRGRVEVVCAGQDSVCFLEYLLEALGERHRRTGREVISWCWTTARPTPAGRAGRPSPSAQGG